MDATLQNAKRVVPCIISLKSGGYQGGNAYKAIKKKIQINIKIQMCLLPSHGGGLVNWKIEKQKPHLEQRYPGTIHLISARATLNSSIHILINKKKKKCSSHVPLSIVFKFLPQKSYYYLIFYIYMCKKHHKTYIYIYILIISFWWPKFYFILFQKLVM